MKIVRHIPYNLLFAGATTACLIGFHGTMQPMTALAKPPVTETSQRDEPQLKSCQLTPSGKLFAKTELFFGLSKPNGTEISEADFQKFFHKEVVSRFPEGSTVLSGQGQFRNAKGIIVSEPARLLILFYPIETDNRRNQSIEQIRTAYKTLFQQESVLRSDNLSCVSF